MIDNSGIAADALQLANDRPTSNNDDLYQWAVDAEEMLREQAKVIETMRNYYRNFQHEKEIIFQKLVLQYMAAYAVDSVQ